MHLQVYVDTRVYLGLLAARPGVTPEMSKFLALCQNVGIHLLMPQQTTAEYHSNREDVVASTLRALKESSSFGGVPPIIQNHELGDEIARLRRSLADKIKEVERWYSDSAKTRELPFDNWMKDLCETGTVLKSEPEIVIRASQRAAMHRLPGKGDGLGDRLIWECLLDGSEFLEDLHLITADSSDYRCPLNRDSVRRPLQDEWTDINWGKVTLYSSIEEFFERAGQTQEFERAAEIARSIWALRNLTDDQPIVTACEALHRHLPCLSLRQAHAVAEAAKTYYAKVFITADEFDRFLCDFYRSYGKHFSQEEADAIRPIVAVTEGLAHVVAANSN